MDAVDVDQDEAFERFEIRWPSCFKSPFYNGFEYYIFRAVYWTKPASNTSYDDSGLGKFLQSSRVQIPDSDRAQLTGSFSGLLAFFSVRQWRSEPEETLGNEALP